MKFALSIFILFSIGCSSLKLRQNRELLANRKTQLQSLSRFKGRTCTVEVTLSAPVKNRYLSTFSEEKKLLEEPMLLKWDVQESGCRISNSNSESPLMKAQQPILNAAFCTLLQAHFVNSPFDELKFADEEIEDAEDRVVIRKGEVTGLAVYKSDFLIETLTKNLGRLRAHYFMAERDWLPDWIEQKLPESVIRIDQMSYGLPRGKRTPLESFWISVGQSEPQAHTFVKIEKCN